MGRVLLVVRLAARNLRRRPAEAALLLLAITAATTVLTLGLVLRGVTDDPYQNTRQATAGPDVVASVAPDPAFGQPADVAGLEALTDASGVVDHSGPYPAVGAELEADGLTGSRRTPRGEVVDGAAGVWAVGRDPAAAPVDQPELTQGSWVRDGGAVVEAGFADALDVGVGDQITLRTRLCTPGTPTTPDSCHVANDRSFRVVGVAVTAAARPYPGACFAPSCDWFAEAIEDAQAEGPPPDEPPPDEAVDDVHFAEDPVEPGLVWLTEADARGLAAAEDTMSYVVNLKLADPTTAPAFVDAHFSSTTGPGSQAKILESWQQIRDAHDQVMQDQQNVLHDRQPAARHTRRGQRRSPRRRPDGRPDPTRRTAQSGRRHSAPGRSRTARRICRRGPARGRRGAGGRMGCRAVAHRSRRRPPRPRRCAVAHPGHGRSGDGGGARGRGHRHLRARRARRPHQHRPRPGRRRPPTPAHRPG